MSPKNGKSDLEVHEIDAQHELPAAEAGEASAEPVSVESGPRDTELTKLKSERDSLLRMLADMENARKRGAKEQQEFREYALADALKTLLPILDSFQRALQTSAGEKSEFRGGVELIYKQLQDALGKLGLSSISATGKLFDPHLHQAIEMVDTDEVEDHHVVEELQQGYKLKDRLLRPSMVKVARNPGK
jgi:molecular chaperone GrpE